jgi:hypothetical protein
MMVIVRFFIGILVICNLLILSSCSAAENDWPNTAFSSSEWKSTPIEKRYIYFNSLVRSVLLNGLTQKEVVHLLGPPNYKSPNGKYFTYILKYAEKKEYSLNSIYLLDIDFNAEGKVLKYFRRTD